MVEEGEGLVLLEKEEELVILSEETWIHRKEDNIKSGCTERAIPLLVI